MNLIYKEEYINNVIVDTNILRYSSHPVFAAQIEQFLEKLIKKDLTFSISEISVFELLQAVNQTKEEENISILNNFVSIEVTRRILATAARLAGIYQTYGGINLRGFDSGDLFIATTAILDYSFILTSNQKDYPHPIFQEIESFVLSSKDKFVRTEYTAIYLLKPNYDFLKDKLITDN